MTSSLLNRQIHPTSDLHEGRLRSSAFHPNSMDKDMLSTDDASVESAETSFVRYTVMNKRQSAGVVAVCKSEVAVHPIEVTPDPLEDHDSHVLIDFSKAGSKGQKKKIAKALGKCANGRGWQHNPSGLPNLTTS